MRIGIDARMYRSSVAGIGRYSQNLIRNLLELDKENEYVLFMTNEDYREFQKSKAQRPNGLSHANLKLKQNPNVKIQITNIPHFSLSEQTKLPKILEREKLDLMHFLNFNYPVRYRGRFIVTIHDLTLLFYPETARQTNIFKRAAFKYVMKKACQNSEKIIAVSENTKKDIIRVFKVKSQKIKVIYEAVNDGERNKEEIRTNKEKIILYVGQFRPHKNLPNLVRAFEQVKKEIPAKLVLLGKTDSSCRKLIDNSPEKRDIVMPGFVSNGELASWYKTADVFVFPSFYEGFGLPGLEAMAAGLPVVAAKTSSLPEIYQDAALYFDPFKPQEIADKIKMVLVDENLRQELIVKGKIQSQKYSWRRTAQQTLGLYKEVVTN